MTQREKNIKKQNNKGSSPARGTMLKPFFLLLLFLCPEAEQLVRQVQYHSADMEIPFRDPKSHYPEILHF